MNVLRNHLGAESIREDEVDSSGDAGQQPANVVTSIIPNPLSVPSSCFSPICLDPSISLPLILPLNIHKFLAVPQFPLKVP